MNKTRHVTAAICLLALGVVTVVSGARHLLAADEQLQQGAEARDSLVTKLIGTWKLKEAKTPGSPSGIDTRLKFFTGTHWSIIQPDPTTGVIIFHHGGRYELNGNTLRTTRDFAGESTKSMIGTSGTFTIQIEGDTLKQIDAKGVYNETWQRVK